MLSEQHRTKLDGIVQQMTSNGESDANIRFVVGDFKGKYDNPRGLGETAAVPPPPELSANPPPSDTNALIAPPEAPVASTTGVVNEEAPAQAPASVVVDPRTAVSPLQDLGLKPDPPKPVEEERGFFGDVAESFKRGNEDTYLNSLFYDAMTGKRTLEEVRKVEKEFAQRRKKDPVEANGWLEKIVFGAAGATPALAQGVFEGQKLGGATGLAAAGIGAVTGVGAAATGAVGYAAGSAVGSTEYWRRLGAGSMYREMVGQGINPEIAGTMSKIVSLPYALVERAQVSRYAPGLDKQLKKAITKSLMKRVGKFITGRAIDIGVEDLQEGVQGGMAQVAKDISSIIDPHMKNPKLGEAGRNALSRIKTDMVEALPTVIGLGAPKGIVGGAQILADETIQKTDAQTEEVAEPTQLAPEEQAASDEAARAALGEPAPDAGTVQLPQAEVKEVPQELLNPLELFDKDIEEEQNPDKKKRMQKLRARGEDKLLKGVYKFGDVEELEAWCRENDVPFAHVRGDGRELKAWNKKHGDVHADADAEIQQVWGDVYARRIKEVGGLMTREEGDEFQITLPNMTDQQADEFLESVQQEAMAKVEAMDLNTLPSAKGEYEGLPMGTGMIDMGFVPGLGVKPGDADRVADKLMAGRKVAEALDVALKNDYNVRVDPRNNNKLVGFTKDPVDGETIIGVADYVGEETEEEVGDTPESGRAPVSEPEQGTTGTEDGAGVETEGTGEGAEPPAPVTGELTTRTPTPPTAEEAEAEDALPEAPRGVPKETTLQFLQRKIQDKFNRLNIVQKSKAPKGLPEDQDAYLQQEVMQGKVENTIDEYKKKHITPVEKVLHKSGATLSELDEYLIARHAAERNAMIAERRPDWAEQGIPGSGMFSTQAEKDAAVAKNPDLADTPVAEDILNSPNAPALEEAGRHIWEMNKESLQARVDAGLLSQEQADAFGKFKHYVPLRGVAGEEAESGAIGQGLSVGGKEFQRAKGRRSMAQSPTAFSITQAAESAVRGEKNKVGQSFLKMVQENPDPELWEIDEKVTKPVFDENKGEVVYRTGEEHPLPENVMRVKEGGKEYHITIKDPILARAMNNLGAEKAGKVLQMAGAVSRWLSIANTSLVPEFVISNFSRDIQTALVNISGEDVSTKEALKMAGSIVKNVGPAMKGVWDAKRTNKKNKWTAYAAEFSKAGGKIGFFGLDNIDDVQKRLIRNVNAMKPGVKGAATKVFRGTRDLVMDINESVENSTRLATYVTMREQGMSETQAASAAKNITVNFNKKGELGSAFNAMYIFANAGVQGTTRLFKALKSPRVQKIVTAAAVGSFGLSQMNRHIAGEDDDGENYYDKVPDWVKQNNIVIMKPGTKGEYFKIPVPYGYNVFWALGQAVDKVVHNPDKAAQAGAMFAGAVGNAFNPLGSASTLVQSLTPTVGRPLVDLGVNKNFFGAPIVPEQKFGPAKAKSHRAFKSTSAQSQAITKGLNELTGGTRYQPGYIDIPPDVIDYVVEFAAGGAGRTVNQVVSAAGKMATQQEIPIREVPFARRFMGKVDERQDMQQFYDNIDKLAAIKADKKYQQEAFPEKAQEFINKNTKALTFIEDDLPAFEKTIRGLRTKIKNLDSEGSDTKEAEAQLIERMKKYNARIKQVLKENK